MGGEKIIRMTTPKYPVGSPPHGRGKVDFYYFFCPNRRITPAWAGKRVLTAGARITQRDHPRTGGEKFCLCRCHHGMIGSPPHRRGKAAATLPVCTGIRITPAQAGKSPPIWDIFVVIGDHPRTGGEKCPLVSDVIFGWGSPPHRRGKVPCISIFSQRFGITPAQAGKSRRKAADFTRAGDHPRTGGEKRLRAWPSVLHTGSPPHRRGKVSDRPSLWWQKGITPAQAGKSKRASASFIWIRDHPRTGGEKAHSPRWGP